MNPTVRTFHEALQNRNTETNRWIHSMRTSGRELQFGSDSAPGAPAAVSPRNSGKSCATFRVFTGLPAPDAPTIVCHSLRGVVRFLNDAPKAAGTEGIPWQPHWQAIPFQKNEFPDRDPGRRLGVLAL